MPTFSYNLNIPAGPNNPSNDQPLMQTNTNSINSIIGVDHFSFGTGKDGFHQQVTLPVGGIPSSSINQGVLFTQNTTPGSALFATFDNTGHSYQLTTQRDASFSLFAQNIAYGTPPAGFTQRGGWTFLPGGFLYQYGFFGKTGATGSSGNIQFPVTYTSGATIVQMTLFRNSGNQSLSLDSTNPPTTTQFSFLTSSAGSDGIFWFSIGI